ncbi:unnamed protein product [Notodromas monacha]|uniref:Tetratricopeptide repeat protein 21B n=1 Tax=Notodromas monacha TaxID=399045 RepID=A0A7R9BVD8_9CRUS|nr:unnamed protein product [Notodromas monacha]CAG0921103.1 unnamed protein product [Notodromas monacha]
MADEDQILKSKINYFCREKYFRAMQQAAVLGMKKFSGDPVFKFYYGLSLIFEGRIQEGIREMDRFQGDAEIGIGTILALIHAHKKCLTVDREAVAQLEAKLKDDRRKASDKALYFAGVFLTHAGRHDKAREYIDRMLKLNPSSRDGLILKGWIELLGGRDNKSEQSALDFFEAVPNVQRDVDAMMGIAKFFEFCHQFDKAVEFLNQVVAVYTSFLPPLIEKMKLALAVLDWDQARDMANRAQLLDESCLEARRVKVLYILCQEGEYENGALAIRNFFRDMERLEPKNSPMFLMNSQLFSRLCGRHMEILEETYKFAERAAQLDPNCSEYLVELGNQCLLQNKVPQAMKYFKTASQLDESSIEALTGVLACQLMNGDLSEAEQQLEFQKEISRAGGSAPEILYLSALLNRLKNRHSDESLGLLKDAVENHFRSFRSLPFGIEYLHSLNPDFLLQIVKESMLYAPNTPSPSGQMPPMSLKFCHVVLESIARACPALRDGVFLFAKTRYLLGETKSAQGSLQQILDKIDPSFSEAHLLMAEIQMAQGQYQQAKQSLEVGLSYNFKVRDHPIYHLIKARLEKRQDNYEEAIESLQLAMTLPVFKKSSKAATAAQQKVTHAGLGMTGNELTNPDRAAIYVELADSLRLMKKTNEAAKIMEEARHEFMGTPEEMRVTVSNADMFLSRGDVDGALSILKNIGPEQAYYLQAREKMAKIYLDYRKDPRMYAACYKEIMEKFPTPQSFLMLGDAYMSIQEPDKAIEVYEMALKRNPRDAVLARKMGQALVKTHQYAKAVNYYKEAVRTGDELGISDGLRYDMAELHFRLRQYDKAEKAIVTALDIRNQGQRELGEKNEVAVLNMEAKLLALLALVQEKSGQLELALESLKRARETQGKVLKRAQVDQSESLDQKKLAANICKQMAEHAVQERQFESGIRFYKEALSYLNDDPGLLLDLAKQYMVVNDLDQCRQTCVQLLKLDKDNDAATVMMADLAFRKNDYETAMFHFQQLLDRNPTNWEALARLVEVMRRTGHLEECPTYLTKAAQCNPRASLQPGYYYCNGLYLWYTGDVNEALKSFNRARRDAKEWGQKSVKNMILICLNPDNDTIGGETFETVDVTAPAGAEAPPMARPVSAIRDMKDAREMALHTADKLFKELSSKNPAEMLEKQLLGMFIQMATKQKGAIEIALQESLQLAQLDQYRDHVGVILAMSTAYMLLKQVPRARNTLKRVAKSMWTFEDAEYLEKCWILLADIYVQSGKYDMASELLKRVLDNNQSCAKAYEYMGFIMEKEQSYRDAANYYERAWKFSNQVNPMIGYKLAFNYMKARRYVDAIDVCHLVLGKNPEYPKIRKDILEKSRDCLRR